jgi:hypothetical protein
VTTERPRPRASSRVGVRPMDLGLCATGGDDGAT